jgi:glycosyltransferase involved in cell wall biosynthesis
MDIVALSHLRWDFVYQRPQHLLSRAARSHRVLFVEEPVPGERFRLEQQPRGGSLTVVRPVVPEWMAPEEAEPLTAGALRDLVADWRTSDLVAWHYSVMMEPLSRGLDPDLVVFDCMDELSAFRGAPPDLLARERALMSRADLVFTGGHSLWEAKRSLHPRVHAFPSSVDRTHFARAREEQLEPEVLAGIGRPRLVYAGVIDERIDLDVVKEVCAADIGEVVLIGPVAKIDPADVPSGPRIHQLGMQPYEALPALFSHADIGLMPFALNESTRFISPTKTPEYLAAGLPVVSTPITDVVRGYGDLDMVEVAEPQAFVDACRRALARPRSFAEVDERLAGMSWDATWDAMEALMGELLGRQEAA